jgi:hypothetical protein
MITDSLRAMILEQEGYAVTVAEFVGGENIFAEQNNT